MSDDDQTENGRENTGKIRIELLKQVRDGQARENDVLDYVVRKAKVYGGLIIFVLGCGFSANAYLAHERDEAAQKINAHAVRISILETDTDWIKRQLRELARAVGARVVEEKK